MLDLYAIDFAFSFLLSNTKNITAIASNIQTTIGIIFFILIYYLIDIEVAG